MVLGDYIEGLHCPDRHSAKWGPEMHEFVRTLDSHWVWDGLRTDLMGRISGLFPSLDPWDGGRGDGFTWRIGGLH